MQIFHLAQNKVNKNIAGFTLLEVLIAIAILAIAFVTLLGTQAKTISLATDTLFYQEASMLAAGKLAEYESNTTLLANDSGDFQEAPNYFWQLEVEDYFPENVERLEENSESPLKKLTLTVGLLNSNLKYSVTYYHHLQESEE